MKKIYFLIIFFSITTYPLFAQWGELGGLNGLAANDWIQSICSDASGNVYAAGRFRNSSGNCYVAKWNGTVWSEIGGLNGLPTNGIIRSLCSDASGNIYAAGDFFNSLGKRYVAKWNGSNWSELGGLNGLAANNSILSICIDVSGNIYAAGTFTNVISPTGKCYVAKWNGNTWSELGGLNGLAANGGIWSVCSDAFDNIYAAGAFTNDTPWPSGKCYVAKWDGNAWNELGGLNGLAANDWINSICSNAAGNILAAGGFTNNSGNSYVAQWDGSAWSELGGLNGLSANSWIYTLCSDAAGNIYTAGNFYNSSVLFYVAIWNGSTWSELGGSNGLAANWYINSVCVDSSGNIYSGGRFSNSLGSYYVAKYVASTGIENVFLDNSEQLFPNPAMDEINIQIKNSKIKNITLFDISGKKVVCEVNLNNNKITIDVSNLEAGIYFVKLFDGEKIFNQKIIVE